MSFNVYNTRYCKVYIRTISAIPNDAETLLSFDAAEYNEGGVMWNFNGSPATKVIAPVDGLYTVCANAAFQTNATGARLLQIRVNGVTAAVQSAAPTTTGAGMSVSNDVTLMAGDAVTVGIYQNSGSPLNLVVSQPFYPMLSVFGRCQP